MPPPFVVLDTVYKTKNATYKPRKPRSSTKLSKRPRKRAKSKIDLRREWLVPDSTGKLRYVGIRGVYWYWLSRDVRKSEWEKYGICITCLGSIEDWRTEDCGHIIASDRCGEYLRLNRKNLTLQHKKCNNSLWTPQAGVLNTLNMDKRHGAGYMESLRALMTVECKEPTTNEYKELIQALPSYKEALNLRKDIV